MAMKPVNIAARRLRDLHSIKRAVAAVTEKAKSEGAMQYRPNDLETRATSLHSRGRELRLAN